MTNKYQMNDLLNKIRKQLEIQDDAECFHAEIAGIRTEFEPCGEELLLLRTEYMELELRPGNINDSHNKLIDMFEFGETVYKQFNFDHSVCIFAFLSEDIDKSKKPPEPFAFNFVLKVYKHLHHIEDTADRFQMNYEGAALELESVSEDEIVIRWDRGELCASSFLPYPDKLLAQDREYFDENITLSNYSKVAVLKRAHIDEHTDHEGMLAALKLLLSYYHGLLIRTDLYRVIECIDNSLAYRQNDAEVDGIRYAVYVDPSAMI